MNKTCLLFMMHDARPGALREYERITRMVRGMADVFVLFDATHGGEAPPLPVIQTAATSLPSNLIYPSKTASSLWPQNIELPVMNFWAGQREYDVFWVVEYDVRYHGDWGDLLRAFEGSKASLLASTIYDYDFRPGWAHWNTLVSPRPVAMRDRTRALMPVHRISESALSTLDQAYRQGWGGHYEVTVPTVLKLNGHTLEDFGGDGAYVRPRNRNRYYLNHPETAGLGPGTLVHTRDSLVDVVPPGMIEHPVKD